MLKNLLDLLKKLFEILKPISNESENHAAVNETTKPINQNPESTKPQIQSENPKINYDIDSSWNYGFWKEVKTYDDIKAAMIEAQKNRRPILVALSKPVGCINCTNYWRHVTCDGILEHDKNCYVNSKNHPIVEFAKEKKIVMVHLSPSKFPNIASKIMGKEYEPYLHKSVYYPIYFVVSVKDNIDLNEVQANDKILNPGNDAGDTVNFIMGYNGISGKQIFDYQGNKTNLVVKNDETGWDVFKSNMEAVFADTSKTYEITL